MSYSRWNSSRWYTYWSCDSGKELEEQMLREALEHYQCAHYDHQGNPCYHDKTADEALAQPADKAEGKNG